MRILPACLPILILAGCATLTDGDEQLITITTDPPGAACVVDKVNAPPGDHVDEIATTPGSVLVHNSKAKLKITCALQGSPTTQAIQSWGVNPYASVNVLNGVIIGTAIDAASGALYRYPNHVHLKLVEAPPPPPAPGGPGGAPPTPDAAPPAKP